jgi:hypothetical protein
MTRLGFAHLRGTALKAYTLALALALVAATADAQSPPLKPELSGLGFLTGHWSSGRGQIADTGGTSTGSSNIEAVANGAVLLRRDHTNLFDSTGKPTGGFDQIMMIYAEGGTLHADYFDGDHVIHYTSAAIVPGKSVSFTSAVQSGVPVFKLAYALATPTVLSVAFSMAPPGTTEFHPIATGTLNKDRSPQ